MTKLAETFQIQPGCITKHPDADRLDVVDVYADGRTFALVKRGDFTEGEIAVFIPAIADPMVDTNDARFAFLASDAKRDGYARIKVKKLRGVESRGLVFKLDDVVAETIGGAVPDVDVSEALKVKKYDPFDYANGRGSVGGPGYNLGRSQVERGPDQLIPGVYDVDGVGKYHRLLIPGEQVVITEKIHGANASFYWHEDRLFVRSRNLWKAKPAEGEPGDAWWEAATACGIEAKYLQFPEHRHLAFYGEVYGRVQDLTYGLTDRRFILFDVWDTVSRKWLSPAERAAIGDLFGLQHVPVLYSGPWQTVESEGRHRPHPEMYALAEGVSVEAARNGSANVREGFVVEPVEVRHDMRIGRVKLKWVGTGYSTRKGA